MLETNYIGAVTWLPPQEGREKLIEQVTPMNYIRPGLPPICILHNRNDPMVPYAQSETLSKALQAAGVDYELHGFEEAARHGLTVADWPKAQAFAFAFLEKHGVMSGPTAGKMRE